jgi:hypothetical protein
MKMSSHQDELRWLSGRAAPQLATALRFQLHECITQYASRNEHSQKSLIGKICRILKLKDHSDFIGFLECFSIPCYQSIKKTDLPGREFREDAWKWATAVASPPAGRQGPGSRRPQNGERTVHARAAADANETDS